MVFPPAVLKPEFQLHPLRDGGASQGDQPLDRLRGADLLGFRVVRHRPAGGLLELDRHQVGHHVQAVEQRQPVVHRRESVRQLVGLVAAPGGALGGRSPLFFLFCSVLFCYCVGIRLPFGFRSVSVRFPFGFRSVAVRFPSAALRAFQALDMHLAGAVPFPKHHRVVDAIPGGLEKLHNLFPDFRPMRFDPAQLRQLPVVRRKHPVLGLELRLNEAVERFIARRSKFHDVRRSHPFVDLVGIPLLPRLSHD